MIERLGRWARLVREATLYATVISVIVTSALTLRSSVPVPKPPLATVIPVGEIVDAVGDTANSAAERVFATIATPVRAGGDLEELPVPPPRPPPESVVVTPTPTPKPRPTAGGKPPLPEAEAECRAAVMVAVINITQHDGSSGTGMISAPACGPVIVRAFDAIEVYVGTMPLPTPTP